MPLNLATLDVVEDVEIPTARRGRVAADNPMIPIVQSSHDNAVDGLGKSIGYKNVPNSEARELINLIRYAANALKYGIRVYATSDDGQEVTLGRKEDDAGNSTGLDIIYKALGDNGQPVPYTGPVTVSFRTQKRKERKPKPEAATNGATPDASDDQESGTNGDTPTDESSTEDTHESVSDTPEEAVAETATPRGRRRR
jgi:hypothetical protein